MTHHTQTCCSVLQTPGLGTAGNLDVTLHFEASLRGGEPLIQRSAYRPTISQKPNMFQVYPVVSSITPSEGSTAGKGSVLHI